MRENSLRSYGALAAFTTFINIGCGPSEMTPDPDVIILPPGSTITRSYQQDVDGYTGTRSVGISTYNGLGAVGQYNANGLTFADGMNDWCTGTDIPPTPYSEVWLLRFDNLDIPAGSRVTAATLSVYAYGNDKDAQLFLDGKYLATAWNATVPGNCAGCSSSPVGWRYRDGAASPWTGLGASGAGDVVAVPPFRLPATGFVALGSAPQPYSTPLDPNVVQGWVNGANYGLRISAGVEKVHMGYVQSQRDPSASRPSSMRPKLTITYVK